jgi:murein DD-endopeptidase MepM/ murein hydrolase activator NlpD
MDHSFSKDSASSEIERETLASDLLHRIHHKLLIRMIISVVVVFLMFIVGLYLTLKRNFADKESIDNISRVVVNINRNTDTIFTVLRVLAENDSAMSTQLQHFPSTAPLDLASMSRVTSVFNNRIDPITKELQFHWGVDFSTKRDSKVYAAATGFVEEAGWDGGYGNAVKLNHENGYETFYAHLDNIKVIKGQIVHKGDLIGAVGSTGSSTGSHLHYEISYLNHKINPKVFTSTY